MKTLVTFKEFDLSPEVMKAVSKMGFEEATPIQAATIPLSLQIVMSLAKRKQEQENGSIRHSAC